MPITINGTTGLSGVDGSAGTPALQGSDSNTGIAFGADTIIGSTGGSERFRVDSSGRLGIGTTSPATRLNVGFADTDQQILRFTRNDGVSGFEIGYVASDGLTTLGTVPNWPVAFKTGATERARIDTSGRLLVGTTSGDSNTKLHVSASENTSDPMATDASITIANTVNAANNEAAAIKFNLGSGNAASISAHYDNFSAGVNSSIRFYTQYQSAFNNPAERMRIRSYGQVDCFCDKDDGLAVRSAKVAGGGDNVFTGYHTATNTTNGTASFAVRTNGNVLNTNNSYGALSDIKLKENIVDANSQWDDLKALQIRNYNFKEETGQQTHTQIGLIAQEVELVSPGLVTESPDRDEDGNDLGTITKSVNYSVLYMKAVKALQEAMERIESLETRLAALEVTP